MSPRRPQGREMKYSPEEARRLCPEFQIGIYGDGDFANFHRNGKSVGNDELTKALLDTRRQLELAWDGLEKVAPPHIATTLLTETQRIARDSIAALEGVAK